MVENVNNNPDNELPLTEETAPISNWQDNVLDRDRFKYGEVILIYENRDTIKCITLEKGKVHHNKFGAFKHEDIVGKPYGSKIVSEKSKGFIVAIRFVPYLWDRSINRLTQILFNADISIILTLLNITKNSIIYESGKLNYQNNSSYFIKFLHFIKNNIPKNF